MLRINRGDRCERLEILKLEGTLSNGSIDMLGRAAEISRSSGAHLRLDLAGLSFVDTEGAQFLRRLRASGVEIANASVFVRQLLSAM